MRAGQDVADAESLHELGVHRWHAGVWDGVQDRYILPNWLGLGSLQILKSRCHIVTLSLLKALLLLVKTYVCVFT